MDNINNQIEEYRVIVDNGNVIENYMISNRGTVANVKTKRFLKPIASRGGFCVSLCIDGKPVSRQVHRLLMQTFKPNDDPTKNYVEHINKNNFDNRLENLHYVSRGESLMNKRKTSTKSYKGITLIKASNKWKARIKANGITEYLGCYKTEIEAARAFNKRAIELFGENARLNEIPE